MEIRISNLLTNGNCSFYFGKADKLSSEKHKEAYVEICSSMIKLQRYFFDKESDVKILVKHFPNIKDEFLIKQRKENNITLLREYFFENLKSIFRYLYNLEDDEVTIISGKIRITIFSDPIVIKCFYGDENLQDPFYKRFFKWGHRT